MQWCIRTDHFSGMDTRFHTGGTKHFDETCTATQTLDKWLPISSRICETSHPYLLHGSGCLSISLHRDENNRRQVPLTPANFQIQSANAERPV